MCGIVGIIGDLSHDNLHQKITAMNNAQRHRGPDEDGVHVDDGFAMGMVRLSIVDLTGGTQPIWTGDQDGQGNGIVFNGEIYNHKSLRENLPDHITFKTNSDTEALLHTIDQKGIDGLQDLNGMFGFAYYNANDNRIILARDRIGIKPLYYADIDGVFYFASEIKSIIKALPKKPEINMQGLSDFLTYRYVPAPNTIWKNIYKLQPGHVLNFDIKNHQYDISCYWNKTQFESEKSDSSRNYSQEFEELFLDSVNQRLLSSDVDVGIMLSGGLDSSAIGAAATLNGHKNLHSFSIAFEDGGDYSELPYAREVANHLNFTHHEITIGQKEFLEFLPEQAYHTDEPLADLASIPTYFVSKLARETVKVTLSGEGADEIFAGYNMDEIHKKFKLLKALSVLPPSVLKKIPVPMIKKLGRSGYDDFLTKNPSYISYYFNDDAKNSLWSHDYNLESSDKHLNDLYSATASAHPIDQMQTAYVQSWLVENLLMKADKMSMATALELRVPFLDHRMVEWATTLPINQKIGQCPQYTTKKILRDFSTRHLPASIINRPKRGFPVPAMKWIKDDLNGWARDIIFGKNSSLLHFMNRNALESLFDDLNKNSGKIWLLIILDHWLKAYHD